VVFVFSGQGAQWAGMGRELAGCCPVFAGRLAECGAALAPYTGWSLAEVLEGRGPGLGRADVAQPALWAVMVSLAAVWEAAGVVPDAVAGHSQGEIAAAVVAGMLSLEQGARVVAVRSRALSGLGARGGMISVMMPHLEAAELAARWGGLSVAAVNGPAQVVISGDPGALAGFEAELSARHVLRWPIPAGDFIAHSAAVDELEEGLAGELADVAGQPGRVRMLSTATGRWVDGMDLDAGYWFANLRNTVRFDLAVAGLSEAGYRTFIEVSPHPVLEAAIADTVAASGGPVPVITGTLHQDSPGGAAVLTALARVHVTGTPVDWTAVLAPGGRVDLPTYAFQRQRYWPVPAPATSTTATDTTANDTSPAEARFWAAVDGADMTELEAALAVDVDRPFRDVLPALSSWRRHEHDRAAASSWRYRVTWSPLPVPAPTTLAGTWLILTPDLQAADAVADSCTRALARDGAQLITLTIPAETTRDEQAAILAAVTSATGVAGVVSLLALDEDPLPEYPVVPGGLAVTQILVQALGDAGIAAPLWVLTQGAVAAGPSEILVSPVQAQVWGLGRVAGLEHPDRWGGLADLPPVLDDMCGQRLAALLAGTFGDEDQVAIRPAAVFGRRLVRAPLPPATRGLPAPAGTTLITGGTGAIGGHLARWLAGRGAPRLVLTSRTGTAAPHTSILAAALAGAGAAVQITACDCGDRGQLSALLDWIAGTGPGLRSVMHTAGLVQTTAIEDTSTTELAGVLAAKAAGAGYLDELTAGLELDAFVLFSSISATWGSGQQPAYAAANTYLDALAEQRRARHQPATSVAWGPWDGGGMSAGEGGAQVSKRGVLLMDPAHTISALSQVLEAGETTMMVADMDWARFGPVFTLRRPSPLIQDLPEVRDALEATEDTSPGPSDASAEFARQLASLPAADQIRSLTSLVRAEAAPVLGHSSAEGVDATRAFSELGFDSLTAVELRNRLGAATGLRLPATLLFDYPSAEALAAYLRTAITPGEETTVLPVLAELDRLESMLAAIATRNGESAKITARLDAVISRWKDDQDGANDNGVAEKLDSSTDDEVFDFIGKELGIF
jgi:acyl transferase domain-containing protein/acyl carrier protein